MSGDNLDTNKMTAYFYDCFMGGLFECKDAMPSFLDEYLSLQGQSGLRLDEVSRLREYFGVNNDNAVIRPMWLSRGFLAPAVAFLSARWLNLVVPAAKNFSMEPVYTHVVDSPFPCHLAGIKTTNKSKEPQPHYYFLGNIIMCTTIEIVRRRVSFEAVTAELMRHISSQEINNEIAASN